MKAIKKQEKWNQQKRDKPHGRCSIAYKLCPHFFFAPDWKRSTFKARSIVNAFNVRFSFRLFCLAPLHSCLIRLVGLSSLPSRLLFTKHDEEPLNFSSHYVLRPLPPYKAVHWLNVSWLTWILGRIHFLQHWNNRCNASARSTSYWLTIAVMGSDSSSVGELQLDEPECRNATRNNRNDLSLCRVLFSEPEQTSCMSLLVRYRPCTLADSFGTRKSPNCKIVLISWNTKHGLDLHMAKGVVLRFCRQRGIKTILSSRCMFYTVLTAWVKFSSVFCHSQLRAGHTYWIWRTSYR